MCHPAMPLLAPRLASAAHHPAVAHARMCCPNLHGCSPFEPICKCLRWTLFYVCIKLHHDRACGGFCSAPHAPMRGAAAHAGTDQINQGPIVGCGCRCSADRSQIGMNRETAHLMIDEESCSASIGVAAVTNQAKRVTNRGAAATAIEQLTNDCSCCRGSRSW